VSLDELPELAGVADDGMSLIDLLAEGSIVFDETDDLVTKPGFSLESLCHRASLVVGANHDGPGDVSAPPPQEVQDLSHRKALSAHYDKSGQRRKQNPGAGDVESEE
jgi:hypothetical protein